MVIINKNIIYFYDDLIYGCGKLFELINKDNEYNPIICNYK